MFETTKDSKSTLAHDGSRIVEDVKKMANHLKGDAQGAASDARQDLEDAARRTGNHVRELADSAEHSLKEVGGSVALKIRDNPIQSSLIALAVGLFAGMFYRR